MLRFLSFTSQSPPRVSALDSLYAVIQLIHVIAASIWVGSHLVLVTGPMIRALRLRDSRPILEFYETIAWPATVGLLIAALTGLYMSSLRVLPSE